MFIRILLSGLFFSYCVTMNSFSSSFMRKTRMLMSPATKNKLFSASPALSIENPRVVPITVISGFLGAGKTSLLNQMLKNKSGNKFGLVVNDMATINVDSKQVKQLNQGSTDGIDMMELQSGCICCSIAEELIASVAKLITLSDSNGQCFDHIIIECSGIAEPRKVRNLFQEAKAYNVSLLKRVNLETMITVVDAAVFLDLFGSAQTLSSHEGLVYNKGDLRMRANANLRDEDGHRKVTELLLEQVECADVVLVNKCDLLVGGAQDAQLVEKVISSINPSARVLSCIRSEVPDPLSLAKNEGGTGAAQLGFLDEYRNLLAAAVSGPASGRGTRCQDHRCTDPTHSHNHGHDQNHDIDCCHEQHTCTNAAHNHKHRRDTHPRCTDSARRHDHEHEHDSPATTAEKRFGISSFAYQRRRPFHPARFSRLLAAMGKVSVDGIANWAETSRGETVDPVSVAVSDALGVARKSLLRSKGFVWMATSSTGAYFMSHAGQCIELHVLGRWWADMSPSEWPPGMESDIRRDFPTEVGSVSDIGSSPSSTNHGDRRQELVFIGQFATSGGRDSSQVALEAALDACLLTDAEMLAYESIVRGGSGVGRDERLKDYFSGNDKRI